jgi:hypothetical protein
MNRLLAASLILSVIGTGTVASCSSDSANEGAVDAMAEGSSGSTHRDASANCVARGTPNNQQGIGGYCETNADCVSGRSFCTGVFGAPENAWFCTRPCADDPDCGPGLYCAVDPRGVACVPLACGIADASIEAALDAPSDIGTQDQ